MYRNGKYENKVKVFLLYSISKLIYFLAVANESFIVGTPKGKKKFYRMITTNNAVTKNKAFTVFCTQWLFAITALVWMNPYFVWPTYSSILYYTRYVLILLGFAFSVIYYVNYGKLIDKSRKKWFVFFLGLLIYVIATNLSSSYTVVFDQVLRCLCIAFFLLLTDDIQSGTFQKARKLFIICLIPGLIIYLLLSIGFELPYRMLDPLNPLKSSVYELYFGFVRNSGSSRFAAVFDEPGMMGTFCAMFLAVDGFRAKKKFGNIILLISGILSISLAFFILLVIGLALRSFRGGMYRKSMVIIVIGIAVLLFFNVEISIPWLSSIQERLLSESWDNRTSQWYFREFNTLWSSGWNTILFGKGLWAAERLPYMSGSSSWLNLVYDFGIIGFTFIMLCILLPVISIYYQKNKHGIFLFLACFVASIYQRPIVISPEYMILLFAGCGYLAVRGKKNGADFSKAKKELSAHVKK